MTREQAIRILKSKMDGSVDTSYEWAEAVRMAIEALEQIESGRYLKGECSICSKEFGTLGCCTTVSNHWVYSCKEGMAQYAEALEQEPKRGGSGYLMKKYLKSILNQYMSALLVKTMQRGEIRRKRLSARTAEQEWRWKDEDYTLS